MKNRKVTLVSLASALAALSPTAQASVNSPTPETSPSAPRVSARQPNTFYKLGEDLMSLVTTKAADGTVVAQHYSHSSHASHESHASHYSGSSD